MPFNSIISRSDAEALIPEDASREILKNVPANSAVLTMGRELSAMPRNKRRLPILNLLPTAYFVDGDTGLKQTTKPDWANKYMYAEEIACIVPIPEAVLDDTDYDIWGETRPLIEEAFGKAIDAAVFHGTNKPTDWPDDIATAAAAAGNSVDLSVQIAASEDLYDVELGENGVISKLEADGYMATGHVGAITMRGKLRGVRDSQGQPIFKRSMQDGTNYDLDGAPMMFPLNGALDAASVLQITGDWSKLVYSFRQDMTYKFLDQAVIQDSAGNIIYNLAQQDMVALRCVMRLGVFVLNPINRVQETEADRYPFAILVP